jgi:hypothetical protein
MHVMLSALVAVAVWSAPMVDRHHLSDSHKKPIVVAQTICRIGTCKQD